jgi:hypothetical protein
MIPSKEEHVLIGTERYLFLLWCKKAFNPSFEESTNIRYYLDYVVGQGFA